uniref:Cystatin domain-containing protein n=1 Tax=Leptobrachium leishanense TaxID=445787 RepID=A0A8C5MLK2_9ANUR
MENLLKLCIIVILATIAQSYIDNKSRPRLGGWADVKEPNAGLENALQVAIEEYNKANNGEIIKKVDKIISARQQVVAGMKYNVKVDVTVTSCKTTDLYCGTCQEDENSIPQKKRCIFEVLLVPWMNTKQKSIIL